ncbi:MAG: hypothetical protein GYB65_23475 [Chloroflexi bacterium]|nr:hypothetical protein [Chloroflexota bacterium]
MSDKRLDNELAALTDRVLAGEQTDIPPELSDLTPIIEQLHQTVAPDAEPDAGFQDQLTRRIMREWESHPPRHAPRSRWSYWRTNRIVQLAAAAATLVVVLLAIALLANRTDTSDGSMEGTALGSPGGMAVILAALVIAGLIAFWVSQRRKP